MNQVQILFIEAYKQSLKNDTYELVVNDYSTFRSFFTLASIQSVLPMVCESTYKSKCIQKNLQAFDPIKKKASNEVASQIVRTAQFFDFYEYLEARGLHPIVVKGLVLRNLYPKANFRTSSDEDILIHPSEKMAYHQALLDYGCELYDPEENLETAVEVAYKNADRTVYVEIHQYLIPPESKVYGDLNKYFNDYQIEYIEYEGHKIRTVDVTTHVFFLICHSFKHFLHSGFGIRQISDLVFFAKEYNEQIEWEKIERQSKELHIYDFARAMFKIGKKYLVFDDALDQTLKSWDIDSVDEIPLLEDVLEAGIYGSSDMVRHHSSNATFQAMIQQNSAKKVNNSIISTVFLPMETMKGRYAYLEKYPFLLPFAWGQRIVEYLYKKDDSNALDIIKLGNKRVELLRKYKIIK